jgi:hypothetical protein
MFWSIFGRNRFLRSTGLQHPLFIRLPSPRSSRSDEFGDSLPTHEKKAANRLMGAKAEGGWAVFVWHPSAKTN